MHRHWSCTRARTKFSHLMEAANWPPVFPAPALLRCKDKTTCPCRKIHLPRAFWRRSDFSSKHDAPCDDITHTGERRQENVSLWPFACLVRRGEMSAIGCRTDN